MPVPSPFADLAARGVIWWIDHRPFSKEAKARRQAKRAARKATKRGESLPSTETDMLANLFSLGALKSKTVWIGLIQGMYGLYELYSHGMLTPEAAAPIIAGILTILARAVTDKPLSQK